MQADVWMDIILCSVSQILSLQNFVAMCVEPHLRLVDENFCNKENWSQILNNIILWIPIELHKLRIWSMYTCMYITTYFIK